MVCIGELIVRRQYSSQSRDYFPSLAARHLATVMRHEAEIVSKPSSRAVGKKANGVIACGLCVESESFDGEAQGALVTPNQAVERTAAPLGLRRCFRVSSHVIVAGERRGRAAVAHLGR